MHPVDEQVVHDRGDVDRRRAEKDRPSAELDEIDVRVVACAQQKPQFVAQGGRAPHERREHLPIVGRACLVLVVARGRGGRLVDRSRCGQRTLDHGCRATQERHVGQGVIRTDEQRGRDTQVEANS